MTADNARKPTVCVLHASTYVGFWVLKRLLRRGYNVHAAIQLNGGESAMERTVREMEEREDGLLVFVVDVFDYHSILRALKGCTALFCSLDSPEGYEEEEMVDIEVRGTINVVEACAQTETVDKMIFGSSLTAAVWKEAMASDKDVDERSWSDQVFCRKMKLWYALAKTQSEQAAWALAMDRKLEMVSINAGLVVGPSVAQHNPLSILSYLQGAAEMYESGVLAYVDVEYLADVQIQALEDYSTTGRYLCFNKVIKSEEEAIRLAQRLTPLITVPQNYNECQQAAAARGTLQVEQRLKNNKLNDLLMVEQNQGTSSANSYYH